MLVIGAAGFCAFVLRCCYNSDGNFGVAARAVFFFVLAQSVVVVVLFVLVLLA